jgi:hypothetical protein
MKGNDIITTLGTTSLMIQLVYLHDTISPTLGNITSLKYVNHIIPQLVLPQDTTMTLLLQSVPYIIECMCRL